MNLSDYPVPFPPGHKPTPQEWLAKPFTPEQARECILKYCDWLEAKMNAPDTYGEQVMGLKGRRLLCWCRDFNGDTTTLGAVDCHACVLALVADGHSFQTVRALVET